MNQKKIKLLIAIHTALLLISPIVASIIFAQQPPATYFCTWLPNDNACAIDPQAFIQDTCGEHYTPGNGCQGLSFDECFDHSSANPDGIPFACLEDPYNPPQLSPSPTNPSSTSPPTQPDESLHCQNNEINTAIGCISISDIDRFVSQSLVWSLGIAGGIFLVLSIYAGLLIMTSQGDPRKYKLGNEILLSAVAGLIMLVFSVFLLRFLGVDILKIL